jgi:hypothetical protein
VLPPVLLWLKVTDYSHGLMGDFFSYFVLIGEILAEYNKLSKLCLRLKANSLVGRAVD